MMFFLVGFTCGFVLGMVILAWCLADLGSSDNVWRR